MRIAACSDLHLGFRQFDRTTPTAVNVREMDVARSFVNLIDALIVVQPDVVTIAGDLFHRARPGNFALAVALDGFRKLREALPDTLVVAIGGNHDLARDLSVGSPLPLLQHFGVHIAERQSVRFSFADRDLAILGVPDAPGLARPSLRPDPDARYNVLVLHGQVAGVVQTGAQWRPNVEDITPDELGAPEWDACFLGHFHCFEQVAENAWYSGAIDYTSSNIWLESKGPPKGFIVRDLEDSHQEFIELPSTRQIMDLPLLYGQDMEASAIDGLIADAMTSIEGGYADAIVRQVVAGVTQETQRALDHQAIGRYRRRCLNFALEFRRPELVRAGAVVLRQGGKRQSLEQIVAARFGDDGRTPLPPEINRAEFLARAHQYVVDTYGAEAAGPAPDQWVGPITEQPAAIAAAEEAA